jgi:tellurite resistance-related uncharacterized protein
MAMPIYLKAMKMLNELPPNLQKYSETPVYTQDTVPAGLLKDHNTKSGVWGRITVLQGRLMYLIADHPAQPVDTQHPRIIRPEEKHCVAFPEEVTFKVEFFRLAASKETM